jgi:hypothetical protein
MSEFKFEWNRPLGLFRKHSDDHKVDEGNITLLLSLCSIVIDSLFGLVVRVSGCYPRGPGFDSRRYQIFYVAEGLERGPLSPCEDR